jgi:polysaccharide deacetylase family protein (PEP-CTERM system associated)
VNSEPIVNAFTVDVEDYYQVQQFADRISPQEWDRHESRVVENTHRMLRILNEHQVCGTFFVLGWVAERFPRLVRDIQKAGHEIGCHGYWHRLIYDMTPDEFRSELSQTTKILSDITGQPVVAFRAPSFSITKQSLWALDILIEQGYRYDSSIFPIYHDTYGIPNAERFPHTIERQGGSLMEFPPSVYRVFGFNLPVSGGGYFRLYPVHFSIHWLSAINRVCRHSFIFYVHPWELDPGQPRLPASLTARFRHYVNLRRTERKLGALLSAFRFGTLGEAFRPPLLWEIGKMGACGI